MPRSYNNLFPQIASFENRNNNNPHNRNNNIGVRVANRSAGRRGQQGRLLTGSGAASEGERQASSWLAALCCPAEDKPFRPPPVGGNPR